MIAIAVVLTVVVAAAALLRPGLRASPRWRATVTPLASIIGSGFLVVTPLLAAVVGSWAPVAMAGVVAVAHWVGAAMRLVIAEVEPRLEKTDPSRILVDLDRLSRLLLSFAYVVSVAFYLRLMSSFVLRSVTDDPRAAQVLTTMVLVGIGAVGWRRGLHGLEALEEVAVGIKLSIIASLVVALLAFDLGDPGAVVDAYRTAQIEWGGWDAVRVLAGMLLVVQGFETSRYLGAHYDAPTRIASMRRAQLISAAIYLVFVALSVRVFDALPSTVQETAILDVAGEMTVVLVPLLVVAAVASQLSAAIADTAGGGEMLAGAIPRMSSAGVGYVAVTGSAVAVVWLADVFAIVSLASRAFAAYYLVATMMLLVVLIRDRSVPRRTARLAGFGTLAVLLGLVVVFAIPAGS
ncbi:MAG: hypothetical protein R2707_13665 [Acidimicrobiales bacterium]